MLKLGYGFYTDADVKSLFLTNVAFTVIMKGLSNYECDRKVQ